MVEMSKELLANKLPDLHKNRKQELAYYNCLVGEDTDENRDALKDERWVALYLKNVRDSRAMRSRLLSEKARFLHNLCNSFFELCEYGRKFPKKMRDWSASSFLFGGTPAHPREVEEAMTYEDHYLYADIKSIDDYRVGNSYLGWREYAAILDKINAFKDKKKKELQEEFEQMFK